MTHLLRIPGYTADGFLIAIHSPPAREREVCTVTVQALSVTVTVLGNRKSVTQSDDVQYKKILFGTKKMSL